MLWVVTMVTLVEIGMMETKPRKRTEHHSSYEPPPKWYQVWTASFVKEWVSNQTFTCLGLVELHALLGITSTRLLAGCQMRAIPAPLFVCSGF